VPGPGVAHLVGRCHTRPRNRPGIRREFPAVSETLDLNGPAKPVESIEPEVARHLLHASAALARLRALHGNDAIDLEDVSFIDDEVIGQDSKRPTRSGGCPTASATARA